MNLISDLDCGLEGTCSFLYSAISRSYRSFSCRARPSYFSFSEAETSFHKAPNCLATSPILIPGFAFTISLLLALENIIKEVRAFLGALGSFLAFFLAGLSLEILEDFGFSLFGDGSLSVPFSLFSSSSSSDDEYSSSNSSATSLSLPPWKSRSSLM